MIQKIRDLISRIKGEPESEEISEEWKQLLEDMPISMGDLLYLMMRESMVDTYAKYAYPEEQQKTESDTQSRREKIDAEFKKTRDHIVANCLKDTADCDTFCSAILQGGFLLAGQREAMLAFLPEEDHEYIRRTMTHYRESLCSEILDIAEKKGWV